MGYRKMYEEELTYQMHAEASGIQLSEQRKKAILEMIQRKNNPLGRFWEKEFCIPVKTLVAACAIFVVLIGTLLFPLLRVTEKDLHENRIIIEKGMM